MTRISHIHTTDMFVMTVKNRLCPVELDTFLLYIYIYKDGSHSVPGGQYTYLDGKKQCEKEGYTLFQNIKYQGVSSAFWNSEMWLESTNINELFSGM